MDYCYSSNLAKAQYKADLSISHYEKKQQTLQDHFQRFTKIEQSEDLRKYLELRDFVLSDTFVKRKNEIIALTYKGSKPFLQEQTYKKSSSDKRIMDYYKIKESEDLHFYNDYKDTSKLKRYLELKDYMENGAHKKDKEQVVIDRKREIEELKKKQIRYKELKRKYRWFEKIKKTKDFIDFLHFKDTDAFRYFEALDTEVRNYSLQEIKRKLKTEQKKCKAEKKSLQNRYKVLSRMSRKAASKQVPFDHQTELERLKETLSKGTLEQKIKDAELDNSVEYNKLREHKKLLKNPRVRSAKKYNHSETYTRYVQTKDTEEVGELNTLDGYMQADYQAELDTTKKKTYKNSEVFETASEYKTLKNDYDIKRILKIEKNKRFKNYQALVNSQEIADYEKLKDYIESTEFKNEKAYLEDKNRFNKSEEYQKQQEYLQLNKSDDIVFYLAQKENHEFDVFRNWSLVYEEQFKKDLPTGWSTKPFLASKFMEGTYSQWSDDQAYQEKGNHFIRHEALILETRKEKTAGKAWHPTMGFVPKQFNYSSAIVNSAGAFKMKYGKIEVKIKLDLHSGLTQVVSLSTGSMLPQINLIQAAQNEGKEFKVGVFSNDKESKKQECLLPDMEFCGTYFIYSLIWRKDSLEWFINGIPVAKHTTNIPDQEMFLKVFSIKPVTTNDQSFERAAIEVDYIKAYAEN